VIEKVDWVREFSGKVDTELLKSAANNLMPEFAGYGLEFRHLVYGFAYNTKVVAPADIPTKWEDLANPRWKRKVAIDTNLDPLIHLTPVIGKEGVLALAQRILDNTPVYSAGTRNALQKIMAGEASIGALAVNTVMEEQKKGAPIDFVIPEPLAVIPQQVVFVIKGAPHPNLAKLWTAWFGSEGMASKPIIDEGSLRARAGAPGAFGDYFTKHNLPTRSAKSVAEINAALDMATTLEAYVRANKR
jgi:ABC-type Fe3+ transport system substrate-binding protein